MHINITIQRSVTMGFLDKVKNAAKQIKEENRNFGSTTKRMNTFSTFYGNINKPDTTVFKMDPNDDFCKGSHISIENGKGVIYGTSQDDYVFSREDIKTFTFTSETCDVSIGNNKYPGLRYTIEFNDGKKAQADIIAQKIDAFKIAFGL